MQEEYEQGLFIHILEHLTNLYLRIAQAQTEGLVGWS